MLDGDAIEIKGIGFAGVKGFGGGFGARALGPWGENAIKAFVHEAIDEALKLESAVARLRVEHKVALDALLADPGDLRGRAAGDHAVPRIEPAGGAAQPVPGRRRSSTATPTTAAWKGHTQSNIPVYNVSAPLLRQHFPDRPPFRVIEIPLGGGELRDAASNGASEVPDGANHREREAAPMA